MTLLDRRHFIAALPALAYAPKLIAQTGAAPFRSTGLSQLTLTVSDVAKSLDFYQGLFGMPVQARQGATVLLASAPARSFSSPPSRGRRTPEHQRAGLCGRAVRHRPRREDAE